MSTFFDLCFFSLHQERNLADIFLFSMFERWANFPRRSDDWQQVEKMTLKWKNWRIISSKIRFDRSLKKFLFGQRSCSKGSAAERRVLITRTSEEFYSWSSELFEKFREGVFVWFSWDHKTQNDKRKARFLGEERLDQFGFWMQICSLFRPYAKGNLCRTSFTKKFVKSYRWNSIAEQEDHCERSRRSQVPKYSIRVSKIQSISLSYSESLLWWIIRIKIKTLTRKIRRNFS